MKRLILTLLFVTLVASATYAQKSISPMQHNMPMEAEANKSSSMCSKDGSCCGGGVSGGSSCCQGMKSSMATMHHKGDESPSSLVLHAVNQKMHRDMMIEFSGNVDVDFVKGMIPHHQGAIDMAKALLAFSKNAKTRKLAEDIIKAQEAEIAMMKEWLNNGIR